MCEGDGQLTLTTTPTFSCFILPTLTAPSVSRLAAVAFWACVRPWTRSSGLASYRPCPGHEKIAFFFGLLPYIRRNRPFSSVGRRCCFSAWYASQSDCKSSHHSKRWCVSDGCLRYSVAAQDAMSSVSTPLASILLISQCVCPFALTLRFAQRQ